MTEPRRCRLLCPARLAQLSPTSQNRRRLFPTEVSSRLVFSFLASIFLIFVWSISNSGVAESNEGASTRYRTPYRTPYRTANRRVLVIGIDGATGPQVNRLALGPAALPGLGRLIHDGLYAPCLTPNDRQCARAHNGPGNGSKYEWVTAAGWGSVLTGVDNERHQVANNDRDEQARFTRSSRNYPTFLKRARDLGLKTAAGGVGAFLTSKGAFSIHAGVLDYECGQKKSWPTTSPLATQSCNLSERLPLSHDDLRRDEHLTAWMKTKIQDSSFDIIMGVLDQVDTAGHAQGFGENKGYLAAIRDADRIVVQLLAAVDDSRTQRPNEEWLVLVTSDHGGHTTFFGGDHGSTKNNDDAIPFILTTYGTHQKLRPLNPPIKHMDVHPTVMQWLGSQSHVDGQVQGISLNN